MSLNKQQILTRVSSIVNGESAVPTGDELAQWGDFLEIAHEEWYNAYNPQVLRKQYTGSVNTSGVSMALPADFKESIAGFVDINGSYIQTLNPFESTVTEGSYVTWGGSQADGYYLKLSQALTSTASIVVPYNSRPTSFATLTSISPIPDPEFLIARTSEYAMMQRGQETYVEWQVKANLLLQRLVTKEAFYQSDAQGARQIPEYLQRTGYRLGI